MKGKIFTIAGIVLIFGYFIWDSFHDPLKNPGEVVLSGNDTLGKDWGAAADAKEAAAKKSAEPQSGANAGNSTASPTTLLGSEDPYSKDKINQDNYSTMQAADGRTIITGNEQAEEVSPEDKYKSRHQLEKGSNSYESSNPFDASPYNPYAPTTGDQNTPQQPY